MWDKAGNDRKRYASTAILERKQRISAEAIKCLDASGMGAFRLSEVAENAGVAINTIYNFFGSREGLVAAAVTAAFDDAMQGLTVQRPRLAANIERLSHTVDHYRLYPNRLAGLLSVYFAIETPGTLRQSIARRSHAENGCLAPEILGDAGAAVAPALARELVRWEFATLFDWSAGLLEDPRVAEYLIKGYVGLIIAYAPDDASRRAVLPRPGTKSAAAAAVAAPRKETLRARS